MRFITGEDDTLSGLASDTADTGDLGAILADTVCETATALLELSLDVDTLISA